MKLIKDGVEADFDDQTAKQMIKTLGWKEVKPTKSESTPPSQPSDKK